MVLRSSIIFFLLAEHYETRINDWNHPGVDIGIPLLLRDDDARPGQLFVTTLDVHNNVPKNDESAYIVLCPAGSEPGGGHKASMFVLADMDINDLFSKAVAIYCDITTWNYQLKEAVLYAKSMSDVFAIGHRLYPRQFCLSNSNYEFLAFSPGYSAMTIPPSSEMFIDEDFLNAEKQSDVYLWPPRYRDTRFLCLNILTEESIQIRVLAETDKNPYEGEKQMFRLLCTHIREAYIKSSESLSLLRRQNDKLHIMTLSLLAEDKGHREADVSDALQSAGWSHSHSYQLFHIDTRKQRDFDMVSLYLCSQLESEWPQSCAVKAGKGIVWVVNLTLSDRKTFDTTVYQHLAYFVRDYVCKAGVSNAFSDYYNLYRYCIQAENALSIGNKLRPHFWYYRFNDFVIDYMFENMSGDMPAEQIYYPGILELEKYDRINGTDLLQTFGNYAESIFNTAIAAEKSFVHRSTLMRRLEKIREISGFDLSNPDEVIHVLITFRLMRIRDEPGKPQ